MHRQTRKTWNFGARIFDLAYWVGRRDVPAALLQFDKERSMNLFPPQEIKSCTKTTCKLLDGSLV
jgi:hypothetical protein